MSGNVWLNQERKIVISTRWRKIEIRAADIEKWIGELSEVDFERDKKTRLATYKVFQELEAAADVWALYAITLKSYIGGKKDEES
ncbi:MAG TPA: hypothetical protein ENF64_01620 [Hadesarchaea archaeon]|nr:hypothetical protein [Hadesarchaea archaeon]